MVKQLRKGIDVRTACEMNAKLQAIEGDADQLELDRLRDLFQGDYDPKQIVYSACPFYNKRVEELFLNRDPLVARARIGDGLDDPHVANALLEIRARPNPALRFHRGEKIFFHAPFAFQFRCKIDSVEGAIAELARLHDIGTKIVSERAGAAINFEPVARRHGIDSAELEHAFRAIIERAKDSQ